MTENIELSTFSEYSDALSKDVENGNLRALKNYLQERSNEPKRIFESFSISSGRSPLHDSCKCVNVKNGSRQVANIKHLYEKYTETPRNAFIDAVDQDGNTALHYALEQGNRDAVRDLLRLGADLNIRNRNKHGETGGKTGLLLIYEIFPDLLPDNLYCKKNMEFIPPNNEIGVNRNLTKKFKNSDNVLKIKFDFSVITGINNYPRDIFETAVLSTALCHGKDTRRSILLHAQVQAFLDLKWNKMKPFIYFSMFIHICWSCFASIHICNTFTAKYSNSSESSVENCTTGLFTFPEFEIHQCKFSKYLLIMENKVFS